MTARTHTGHTGDTNGASGAGGAAEALARTGPEDVRNPRSAGAPEADGDVRHTVVPSPLGALTLVADGDALTGVYFEDHLRGPSPHELGPRDESAFDAVQQQLREYFEGRRQHFDVPLAPRGDSFRQRVWRLLRQIPYGQTRSYGQLARELGDPALAQAVGAAGGRNPLSVIVPCHRVVGADGSLTGYAGGLRRKRLLLELEGAASVTGTARLF